MHRDKSECLEGMGSVPEHSELPTEAAFQDIGNTLNKLETIR